MQLPPLLLHEWEQTKMTLHLYLQIAGKIRLKAMPRKNHWWNITLYVNSKGITTDKMPCGNDVFEIQFNFINHRLEVCKNTGEYESFSLHDGLSVAEFYRQLFELLQKLHIDIKILARPYSLPDVNPITKPFLELKEYHCYQPEYVYRFWKILVWVDGVFKEFSGRFYGKTCPVHIYWHHMDMAVTRFSGKKIPLHEGMRTSDKDAYSHEVISFGFWAGDDNTPGAAFYAYAYPAPVGLNAKPLMPLSAKWIDNNGSPMALLMYDDVLADGNPRQAVLDFLESVYLSAATLAGWDVDELKVPELKEL